jgi:GntR family transcriptional regulator, arabinose operon transcriptional repressor
MRRLQPPNFEPRPLKKADTDLPLYVQLMDDLREHIVNGGLPIGARLPNEIELSEKYEVSRGTIRQAVEALIKEGFIERIHGSGTFIRDWRQVFVPPTANAKRIGLIMVNLAGELSMKIMSGVQQVAKMRGYQLSVTSIEEPSDQQAEQANCIARLLRDNVSGIVIFPVSDITHDTAIADLQRSGTPVVLVDRYLTELDTDYVVSDNFAGGYRATEHLIILGYKRIGFVYERQAGLDTTSVGQRFRGYRAALQQYGIDYDERFVFQNPNSSPEQEHELYREFLMSSHRPDAIFAAKDLIAANVIRAARSCGIRIPDELAIVGFDNLLMTAYMHPPLTTVEQSGVEIGLRAANLLADRIEGYTGALQHVVYPTTLVVRESCGARMQVRKQLGSKP